MTTTAAEKIELPARPISVSPSKFPHGTAYVRKVSVDEYADAIEAIATAALTRAEAAEKELASLKAAMEAVEMPPAPKASHYGDLGADPESLVYTCDEMGSMLEHLRAALASKATIERGTREKVVREFLATDEVGEVLRMMCFEMIPIAQVLRKGGHAIPSKAEEEQLHCMRWMLEFVVVHGSEWRKYASQAVTAIKNSLSPSARTEEAQPDRTTERP